MRRRGGNSRYCRSLLWLQIGLLNLALNLSSKMAACIQEKSTSATSITREEMETIISFSSAPGRGPHPHWGCSVMWLPKGAEESVASLELIAITSISLENLYGFVSENCNNYRTITQPAQSIRWKLLESVAVDYCRFELSSLFFKLIPCHCFSRC